MLYRHTEYRRRNEAYNPSYNSGRRKRNEFLQERERELTLYVSNSNVPLEEALQILVSTFGIRSDNLQVSTANYISALTSGQPLITRRAKLIHYYKRLLDERGLTTEVKEVDTNG